MAINVLMIGFDYSFFSPPTKSIGDVRERHILYAKTLAQLEERSKLYIVVYAPEKFNFKPQWMSEHLYVIPTNSTNRLTFFADALRIGEQICKTEQMDVITTQSPFDDGMVGWLLRRKYGGKFCPQIRGDIFSKGWLLQRFPLNLIETVFGSIILRFADRIQVVSVLIKEKLVRMGIPKENILVIPSGITFIPHNLSENEKQNLKKELLAVDSKAPVILFVGRLVAAKNIPLLLRVAKKLLPMHTNAILVIAGDGRERATIEKWQKYNQHLSSRVLLLGSIPYDQIKKIYSIADVFVLPSRWEGLPRVLREAALSSLPIVTTDVSGAREVVIDGETGFVVPVNNTMAMVERISYILNNPKVARDMGKKGAEHDRQSFSQENIALKRAQGWLKLARNR